MSFTTSTRPIQVHRQHCHFNVYVQTDDFQNNQQNWAGKTIFLTVHDVGDTPQAFIEFVNHPEMRKLRKNAVFLHVCVPGQEDNAPDLIGDFPSMDQLGESLVHVLDAMDVQTCIGIGEGAGADILCRFAWEEVHRKRIIAAIGGRQNPRNLSRYLYAFSRRSDFGMAIAEKLDSIPVLLVTGARTPHNNNVHHMFEQLARDKTELLVLGEINDVLMEAPDHFGRALILFCKGFGELSTVQIPGMERQRSLSRTMEEADRPIGVPKKQEQAFLPDRFFFMSA